MKIIDNLRDGQQLLKENNIPSYKIDCEILMSKTLNIPREEVLLNLEKQLQKEERENLWRIRGSSTGKTRSGWCRRKMDKMVYGRKTWYICR